MAEEETNWSEVTGRVVVEAAEGLPQDVVLALGDGTLSVALRLAGRVGKVHLHAQAPPGKPPENLVFSKGTLTTLPELKGVSIVVMNDTLRTLLPHEQRQLLGRLSALLPPRGLLVIGDVMWSFPREQVDAPEQYGEGIEHVQTTATIEGWAREAGFLPDLHRFGPGRAVLVALRAAP